jgi:hypothetical protein
LRGPASPLESDVMNVRVLASAILVGAATLLSGCANEPLVVADASEVAFHRSAPPIVRGADQCVDDISRMPEVGYGDHASITLHIDGEGYARFVSVQTPGGRLTNLASEACQAQIASAVASWRYRPFERDGRAVDAEIVERVLMLPAERWRASPRQFPPILDPNSVVITLERWPALYFCERDRSPSYVLQIRGDGSVTIRGKEVQWGDDHVPRLVEAPVRRLSIGPDAVERLVQQFRAANFFSLDEEYGSGITDQPGQILTLEIGSERARVLDYVGETVGMPMVVRDLQEAVDAAAGLAPLRCGADMWLQAN